MSKLGEQTNQVNRSGFTIVELLIVIAVVGILAGLVFSYLGSASARARDTERHTDINALHSRLEEYYGDRGGYPNTFNSTTFSGLDPLSLKDPNGTIISIAAPVADQAAAQVVANPTATGAQYLYVPYPTGCGAITCTGYVLKTYIELPSEKIPNPYVKTGLGNN